MPENIEILQGKDIFLVPKAQKYRIIEKKVLNFKSGEKAIAYNCIIGDIKVWISASVADALFNIE